MQKFIVLSLSFGGKKNKIFKTGEIITEKDFPIEHATSLVEKGFLQPYFEKEKPTHIDSKNIEFGYELVSVLPYAYWLHCNNLLLSTTSAVDTKCLYFFSENHTENSEKRSFENTKKVNYPNIKIHQSKLDKTRFLTPPLKDHYKTHPVRLSTHKPILCICNRVTSEWLGDPVNFFDNECLDNLFSLLKNKYEIVYFNIKGKEEYYDDQTPIETGEEAIIKKHNIITIHEIHQAWEGRYTFNECQLSIMAKSGHFITMNGGYCFLAGYMGGTNIIYSKKCKEIKSEVNSYHRWYHELGNSRAVPVRSYEELYDKIKILFIEKPPLINILIRTSGRPNYFKSCIESILNQSYKNYNIIVGCDDDESMKYVQPYPCRMIRYSYSSYVVPRREITHEYGRRFKFNLYMNDLHREVKEGYVLYIDDDDALAHVDSLKIIADHIQNNHALLFFKIQFPQNRIVPSEENFGKPPVCCDIDTAGFCFPIKYAVDWEPYKMGDYRVAKQLYKTVPNKIFINEVLTKIQRPTPNGFGRRDDLL